MKMAKFWRRAHLTANSSPAPTIAGRPLDGYGLEANTLPRLVGSTLLSSVGFSFHHDGGNRTNAYCGNNHGNGNFTPKRNNGVGNFSSYAKSYGNNSYDDCGGYDRDNAKYDYYEHSPYDFQEKVDEYHFNIVNYASCVLGVEHKGRSMEKELGAILEELPKIKDTDGNVDNDMVVYKENALKIRFEVLEKSTPTADGSSTPTVTGRPYDGNGLEGNTLLHPRNEPNGVKSNWYDLLEQRTSFSTVACKQIDQRGYWLIYSLDLVGPN
ncbi:hypothetical protein M9H77_23428 [Catharanthus roseus]|uniref:Uncharacterized protein n=1 Tax=Catharanthus roseus TaxID=4058 RepID=A0ACC0ATB4_CATRO|nr:hypothetical protein M9H77_23428 [Catharanthus roseus]